MLNLERVETYLMVTTMPGVQYSALPGNSGRCFCFFVFQVPQCYGWEKRYIKHYRCYNTVVMGAVDVPKGKKSSETHRV